MAKSPSITIREIDKSSYTVTVSDTVLAIVGYGTKGPVGEAKKITSKNEFIQTYGSIPTTSPWGHLAAYRAFNQTNQLIYYRVADDSASESSVVVGGSIDATAGYQEFSLTHSASVTSGASYDFEIAIDGAEAATVTITAPASTTWSRVDIASAIETALTSGTLGASCEVNETSGKIRITSDTTGDSSSIAITAGETGGEVINFLGISSVGTAVDGADADTIDSVTFTSLETGTSNDNISIVKSSYTDPTDSSLTIHNIEIRYNNSMVEVYNNVSLDEDDDNFFVTLINKDPDNGGSEYVSVEYTDAATADTVIEFADGTYTLAGGNDGIPATGGDSLFVTALGTDKDLANSEVFDFHILITPDMPSQAVQDAAITLVNYAYRQDFIYIADPPLALTYSEVVDWHNGGGYGRDAALNNSYAATYWSWLKEYNASTSEYTWVPPSVFLAELYMYIDNNFGPWFAPAGEVRGRLISSDVESSPSFAEREVLYGDSNAVNPIIEFASKGIVVYGQKTTYRANSAVNRINVRRTLIYIKKLIKKAMEGMIYEPHDSNSWFRASSAVTTILESITARGGLSDYLVRIDSNTNTPNLIAQGIMAGVITIVPVGTIERINLDIKFLSPGATISES